MCVSLELAFTDLDEDGHMDFYIGNDGVVAERQGYLEAAFH